MRAARRWILVLVCVVLTGCVTAQRRGEQALYEGHYDEAIHLFQALQQREDTAAADFLTRFRDVARIPRFDAQLERALRVLRGAEPLSADTREFMATSLEDAREVQQARLAAQRAYLGAFPPVRCAPTRRGWMCF